MRKNNISDKELLQLVYLASPININQLIKLVSNVNTDDTQIKETLLRLIKQNKIAFNRQKKLVSIN